MLELGDELGVTATGQRHGARPRTYDYRDENGTVLYQVVRKPGKKLSQRRPG